MDKQKVLEILDKYIERSESWLQDAENRDDSTDVIYYAGQKRVIQDIKDSIERMS
jgi:hypothetical protein